MATRKSPRGFTPITLVNFIKEAHLAGYAAGEAARKVKESDGSTTLVHEHGNWKYHDNYFGGEPYGGREVVFFRGKPVWMMVYYGTVDPDVTVVKSVYSFLQEALKHPPDHFPVRGPVSFSDRRQCSFTYFFSPSGDLSDFSGHERIVYGDTVLYSAHFLGGLVDQRR